MFLKNSSGAIVEIPRNDLKALWIILGLFGWGFIKPFVDGKTGTGILILILTYLIVGWIWGIVYSFRDTAKEKAQLYINMGYKPIDENSKMYLATKYNLVVDLYEEK